mgnify:CR=1 FL=1
MARKRRSFTKQFKRDAVKLVRESGKGFGAVAKELDLTETCLRAWAKQAEDQETGRGLSDSEREELQRLRRENRTLTMERDFLKKAAAFFAKEQK